MCNFACKGRPRNDLIVSGRTLNPTHLLYWTVFLWDRLGEWTKAVFVLIVEIFVCLCCDRSSRVTAVETSPVRALLQLQSARIAESQTCFRCWLIFSVPICRYVFVIILLHLLQAAYLHNILEMMRCEASHVVPCHYSIVYVVLVFLYARRKMAKTKSWKMEMQKLAVGE